MVPLSKESDQTIPPIFMREHSHHSLISVSKLDLRPIPFKVDEVSLLGHRCLQLIYFSSAFLCFCTWACIFLNCPPKLLPAFFYNSSGISQSPTKKIPPVMLLLDSLSIPSAMTLEGLQASQATIGSDARCLVSLTLLKES